MASNDGRETVIVPENKKRIKRLKRLAEIKKKYNENMTDESAEKIRKLEITNKVLTAATGLVGIATIVNYFAPDMLPFADEAIMTGATLLLGSGSKIVKNKIEDIAATGTTEVQMDEVTSLSTQMADIAKKVSEKRGAIAKTH